MESVLAYFYISYSEIPPTLSGEGNISPNSPGVTNFWMRPLFNLRIDPNQLSSGSDTSAPFHFLQETSQARQVINQSKNAPVNSKVRGKLIMSEKNPFEGNDIKVTFQLGSFCLLSQSQKDPKKKVFTLICSYL